MTLVKNINKRQERTLFKMKKKILAFALAVGLTFGLCGCGDMETTIMTAESVDQEPEKISFLADFYDNHGGYVVIC